jgi:hypothetical protein
MADAEGLQHNIFGLAAALQPEHHKKFYFVKYEDLVSQPKESIKNIYDFLEIDNFEHIFNNFEWQQMPNEANVFGIKDMHSVKSSLEPSKTDTSVLSEYVRNKYGNALDFLNPLVKL